MSIALLKKKIADKEARLAVIGLGYVGLPVAASFAKAGFDVLGIDISSERVVAINQGENPIEGQEPGLAELLRSVSASGRLRASSNYGELADREAVLICVETPIDAANQPRYEALRSVLTSLGPQLQNGALVVVESTIAPGTMKNVVLPLLESKSGKKANKDFYLGHCPERVMPGKLLHNLRTLDRVLGGLTPETAESMASLYTHIVEGDLDQTDCITAELVKTTENAYRDVQIAFANEVALISEAVGGDVWKVRELVNKSPGRNMLLPGAGVGGHCIPKDPWLLASAVDGMDVPLRLIPAARTVNDAMPEHMVQLLKRGLAEAGKKLQGARVLVMGYAYLENSDDTRNSPSAVVVSLLEGEGAEAVVHDPYIKKHQGDVMEKVERCDGALLMVRHEEYYNLDLPVFLKRLNVGVFVDGRNLYGAQKSLDADVSIYRLGVGIV